MILRLLSIFAPILSLFFLSLLSLLPFGRPVEWVYLLPFLIVTAIFIWTNHSSAFMPAWLAFCVGIYFDFITGGPVGFWAILFLLAQFFSLQLPGLFSFMKERLWPYYFMILCFIAVLAFLGVSLYHGKLIDLLPLAECFFLTLLSYPLGLLLFYTLRCHKL